MSRFLLGSAKPSQRVRGYLANVAPVDGKNYLVPVDAELTAPAHLKTRTFRPKS